MSVKNYILVARTWSSLIDYVEEQINKTNILLENGINGMENAIAANNQAAMNSYIEYIKNMLDYNKRSLALLKVADNNIDYALDKIMEEINND